MSFNIKSTKANRGRRDKPLSAELLEIGKRCAAHVTITPLCFMTTGDSRADLRPALKE